MTPEQLLALLAALAGDDLLAVSESHLIRAASGPREAPASAPGRVAVVPILGAMSARSYRTYFGAVEGMDSLRARIAAAARDGNVSAIVLDIDSPGGTVAGAAETASAVAAAAKIKPVVAVANSVAASAAYWIGSQASEFVVAPNAIVGSIGVMAVHQNVAKALDRMGVETTLIRSGGRKAEGHPFGPLDDAARAALQARVDEAAASFLDAVAQGRRLSASTARERFGDGRAMGAAEAVASGLADRVATLEATIASLAAGSAKRAPGRRSALAFA